MSSATEGVDTVCVVDHELDEVAVEAMRVAARYGLPLGSGPSSVILPSFSSRQWLRMSAPCSR